MPVSTHAPALPSKHVGPLGIRVILDGTYDARGRPCGHVEWRKRTRALTDLLDDDDPHLYDLLRDEWQPLEWSQWTFLLRLTASVRQVAP